MDDKSNKLGYWPSAACALILLGPFALLIKHENYGYLNIEVLAIAAGLCLVGALLGLAARRSGRFVAASIAAIVTALFVDVQFDWIAAWNLHAWGPMVLAFGAAWFLRRNLWPILTAMSAAIIISTLLIANGNELFAYRRSAPLDAKTRDLPIVLHLILDEHAGIEAIPSDSRGGRALQQRLRAWYREHGFVLFGRAYSQYIDSVDSISHALNFAPEPTDGLVKQTWQHAGENGFHWRLLRNDYFKQLANAGYRVHVYQSQFLDLCGNARRFVASCVTYPLGFGTLQGSTMSRLNRIHVIGSVMLSRSFLYSELRSAYNRLTRTRIGHQLGLPAWAWERERVGPISVGTTLRRLVNDISAAAPGDAFISHLLIPHDPYVYDSSCQLRPPRTWLARSMFNETVRLTPSKRLARYDRYIQQVTCLYRRLDVVMKAIEGSRFASRFVVILHGDHGARLGLHYPEFGRGASLEAVDFRDNYATLFAIKSPGRTANYRLDVRSMQELFEKFVGDGFTNQLEKANGSRSNPIYITSARDKHYPAERCTMRGFDQSHHLQPPQKARHASASIRGGIASHLRSRGTNCLTITRRPATPALTR